MSFVLGYIAFTVGAALHFASLRNSGKRLGLLLLGEALLTPTVVVATMFLIGSMIQPEQMTLRACLILGAIAIAGAPGTTVLVVQEARARGILTRTLVSPPFVGPTMAAAILAAWGSAASRGVSGILACTFSGFMLSNIRHETIRSAEAYLKQIGGVLFAAFYTLAGLKLNFALVIDAAGLVALFFAARLIGKYVGAFAAMAISDMPAPRP